MTVVLIILALWYAAAVGLNAPQIRDRLNRSGQPWSTSDLIAATWSMERPVLPTPDQIAAEFYKSVFATLITSKRSLLYHAYVTASATVVGFLLGSLLGALAYGEQNQLPAAMTRTLSASPALPRDSTTCKRHSAAAGEIAGR
jgi:NitT/TauT family transport system permease protein